MSTEKGQKMTLKRSTEGNKIPVNFIMRLLIIRKLGICNVYKVVRKKWIYSSTNKAGDSAGVKRGKIPHRGLAKAALHPVFRPPLPHVARDRIANCLP